jgi:hypothetical protein
MCDKRPVFIPSYTDDSRFAVFWRKVGLPVRGRFPRVNPPDLVVRRASAIRNLNGRFWESREAAAGQKRPKVDASLGSRCSCYVRRRIRCRSGRSIGSTRPSPLFAGVDSSFENRGQRSMPARSPAAVVAIVRLPTSADLYCGAVQVRRRSESPNRSGRRQTVPQTTPARSRRR